MAVEFDDIREQHGNRLLGQLGQVSRLEVIAQKELGLLGRQEPPQQGLHCFLLADLVQQVDPLQGQRGLVADRHRQLHITLSKGRASGLVLTRHSSAMGVSPLTTGMYMAAVSTSADNCRMASRACGS